jgi:hypothetical protein
MSTRGCIARSTGEGTFKGVYHHWDGYPAALGATLWELYHGHFKQDLDAMLAFLIEEHPAGWSTINDADFKLPAGYQEAKYRKKRNGDDDYSKPVPHGPICYCHGGRHEEASPITEEDDCGMEWAYVFDVGKKLMHVLERVYADNAVSTAGKNLAGEHMVGMFGCGAPGHQRWAEAASVELDGREPEWDALRLPVPAELRNPGGLRSTPS